MKINLIINGASYQHLVIEPWGEEFDIKSKDIEIVFTSTLNTNNCNIEIYCSEEGFLRIENPSGFRPEVLINGKKDERPSFELI